MGSRISHDEHYIIYEETLRKYADKAYSMYVNTLYEIGKAKGIGAAREDVVHAVSAEAGTIASQSGDESELLTSQEYACIIRAAEKVSEAFTAATSIPVEWASCYWDCEDGSDFVEGLFFVLSDPYCVRPEIEAAGIKFSKTCIYYQS
jgi:hypothetical protein